MEESKLSAAEQKKKAKAEKQARRAAQKDQQQVGNDATVAGPNGINGSLKSPTDEHPSLQAQKPKAEKSQKGLQTPATPTSGTHHKRTPSQQTQLPSQSQTQVRPQQHIPLRRRPSQSAADTRSVPPPPKTENKQVKLFTHLYTNSHRHTLHDIKDAKDIHPAILSLGLQMSSYEICGSSARCVAMLLAFKEAIKVYTTPRETALSRHMEKFYLNPQIDYLISCRPLAVSMGNAIRWLKGLVGRVDPDTPEQEVKAYLCESIDSFIRERITATDQAIADSASKQIKNGSVVLTYAKSSIVEKTILEAHTNGTKFRVIVVDSRPLFEGKNLATSLMRAGLEVEYLPFSAISHAVKQANLVLLGAHSMLSNGRLQSRIGTASVAMQAAKSDIPVIVCCESVKFSGKVALDSIVLNEIAPSEELLLPSQQRRQGAGDDEGEGEVKKIKSLNDWEQIQNLQLLNLMYDVTPAEYVRMVVCEYGNIPPSSVPFVHQLANGGYE